LVAGCGDSDAVIKEKADKAFANRDYVAALGLYRKLADGGDAGSQVMVGVLYSAGWGTTRNMNEAVAWYIKAAEQGNKSALSNLANAYKYGWEGGAPNYPEAIHWYEKCVANSGCFVEFGEMYEHGIGMTVDYGEAVRLYTEGANQELTEPVIVNDARLYEKSAAEFHLADMYLTGRGVEANCEEAKRLLLLAAGRNTTIAQMAKNKLEVISWRCFSDTSS
jgi:TPR repeat protein